MGNNGTLILDLSSEIDGASDAVRADILSVLYAHGAKLYAVTASIDGAPWYGLIHEDSTAIVSVGRLPRPRNMLRTRKARKSQSQDAYIWRARLGIPND